MNALLTVLEEKPNVSIDQLYQYNYRGSRDILINGAQGQIRTSDVSYVLDLQSSAFKTTRLTCAFWRKRQDSNLRKILVFDGVQSRCLKPDSATFPFFLNSYQRYPDYATWRLLLLQSLRFIINRALFLNRYMKRREGEAIQKKITPGK